MDGWNTTFLLGFGLFSGAFAVSFREGIRIGIGSIQAPPGRQLRTININFLSFQDQGNTGFPKMGSLEIMLNLWCFKLDLD